MSSTDHGGYILVFGGGSSTTGGTVSLNSALGSATSSGQLMIRSVDAGAPKPQNPAKLKIQILNSNKKLLTAVSNFMIHCFYAIFKLKVKDE